MRPFDPRLLRYAKSARGPILLTALFGTLIAAAVIAQSLLISASASPVITGEKSLSDVLPLIGMLAAIVLLRGLLVAGREKVAQHGADNAIRDLRRAVGDAAEELGPRWRAVHASDTTTLLTRGLDDLVPYFVKFLPQLVLTLTATPLSLAVMLYLDPWSGVIAVLVIPLIPIFMILIGRFTQDSSRAKLATMERLGSQLLDLMAGLPTLRGLGREDGPRRHLKALGKEHTRTTMATLRVAFLSGAVLEFLATLSVALIAVEVGMRLVGGHVDLFTGLAVIMLAPEVFEPLRQVGAQFHASTNGVTASQAAFTIIETPRPGRSDSPEAAPDVRCSDIVLDSVSIAARGTWAPSSLSAIIRPNRITALVGASGSGKTTTIMAILGMLDPTKGTITVRPLDGTRGVDLSSIDPDSWWRQITWVPQSPTIVPGTILDNLSLDAPTDELRAAARITGFDAVIGSLANGWQTRLGFGGVGLSVGQRQRLALTRALIVAAPLVVLDEPTAHLDAVNEEVIAKALTRLTDDGRTVLVIAHRRALINHADDIIEVSSADATDEEIARFPQLSPDTTSETMNIDMPGILSDVPEEAVRA